MPARARFAGLDAVLTQLTMVWMAIRSEKEYLSDGGISSWRSQLRNWRSERPNWRSTSALEYSSFGAFAARDHSNAVPWAGPGLRNEILSQAGLCIL